MHNKREINAQSESKQTGLERVRARNRPVIFVRFEGVVFFNDFLCVINGDRMVGEKKRRK